MSNFDMEQIVDKLAGRAEWVGETYSDNQSLENLTTLEYLIEHLYKQLVHNVEAQKSHPGNFSAEKLGAKSKEILMYIKSEIERLEL